MHSAPCTNTSNSRRVCRRMASISRRESSRASTTRAKPASSAIFAPAALWIAICVEACNTSEGHLARARRATAQSCTMIASAPAAQISVSSASSAGSSSSLTSVLSAMWVFTPRAWQ